MRRLWLSTLVLAATTALALAGVAIAEKPTVVRAGNLILTLNGGVAPKRLPKDRLAPITLQASGGITTADGSQPPAAKQVIIDFDKHGAVNARGLSICSAGRLQAQDTASAKAACPKAIVGRGTTVVRVAFPESTPFNAKGPLLLFNGGRRGRVTTMFIHAYVNVPLPTAIVTRVRIERIHKGPYGTRAIATIPVIAGGSGSVTRFDLRVHRTFVSRHRKQSYLLARCANKRFFAHAIASFRDGSRIAGTVIRGCKQR
ncbi:MAG TPA: hypothetical protein VG518_10475 [Solirubrobacterales bacterium]|nr:hypothetical protein [Solirubrobacterales bacterium]